MKRYACPFACIVLLAALLAPSAPAAPSGPTGSIRGRVLDADNGSYLPNVRVAVEGTPVVGFTDAYGYYRLSGVPAGQATVDAFYTGLQPDKRTVAVSPNAESTADFRLTGAAAASEQNEVVKLDSFVVASQKDTDQKSIAINEQRFAPNVKSVVSTGQFGDITEGNIGEFVKFLPGVSVDYVAADARNIMLRGISPQYTSVTVDGMPMASAASSGSSRVFELEQVSINNVSRIEIVKSRTPDLAAAALGGSVNLVGKSAFELDHPEFTYRAYGTMNGYYKKFPASPGPGNHPTEKILPGADVTYADPVNDHFGFVISFLDSNVKAPQYRSNPQWAPNGTDNSKLTGIPESNPFLEKYQMQDGPKTTNRTTGAMSVDWKFSDENVLSVGAQDNFYDAFFGNRNLTWDTGANAPVAWGPSFTQGAAGKGSVQFGSSFRRKFGSTYNLEAHFRHNGPVWTVNGGLNFSHATNHYQDQAGGHFEGVTYKLSKDTVDYAGIESVKPDSITTLDSSGNPVNAYDFRNYTISGADFKPMDSEDVFRTGALDVSRDVGGGFAPTTVKTGALVQDETRDIRTLNNGFTFVGPDGKSGTADDLASNYNLVDTSYSTVAPPYNTPQVIWPSDYLAYDLWKAHPEYFTTNSSNVQNDVNGSLYLTERISAAYAMGDTRLFAGRVRAVYGIRFERTDDEGRGPLSRTAGSTTAYVDRGARASHHYGSGYPSVNASWNILDNLILRAAYSRSIGRPDLSFIIPHYTLPDPTSTTPQTITVTNIALAPEQANNYDLDLEYYFKSIGMVSAGVFRKDFTNFFGTIKRAATLDLLNQYGIPDGQQYVDDGDSISTAMNVGSARVTGVEFNFSQKLPFLTGVSVFANATAIHLQGSPYADFKNFIAKTVNWGVAYDNRRISAQLNWNYRGRERLSSLGSVYDGSVLDGSAYEYFKPRLYLDANVELRITRHVGIFLNGRNVTNAPQDDQRFGAATPRYAQLYRREMFGAVYTFGVKGTF